MEDGSKGRKGRAQERRSREKREKEEERGGANTHLDGQKEAKRKRVT